MSDPDAPPGTPKPRNDKFHNASGDHHKDPPESHRHSATWRSDLRHHIEGHGRADMVAKLMGRGDD